jgi:hypothetical protein
MQKRKAAEWMIGLLDALLRTVLLNVVIHWMCPASLRLRDKP